MPWNAQPHGWRKNVKHKPTPEGVNLYAMTTWDITKAKLYQEIMTGLASLFNVGTEAEIHAALEKTPTIEAMKAAAVEAVKEEMDGIKASVGTLTQQVADLTAAIAAKDQEIQTLTGKTTDLEAAIAQKEKELADLTVKHTNERNTLSAEVARLQAGRIKEQDADTEGKTGKAGNGIKTAGQVVKAEKIEAFFGGKN